MLGTIWNTILFAPIHNLLVYLYVFTGSLGASVILIIVFVRLLLTPLVIKQYADMKKITGIRPRLMELQAKHKDDPQKLAAAQSALYKEIGYNPLGCFVNIFIQFPIIIALYQAVITFTQHTPATMPGLYPFVQTALNNLGEAAFRTNLFGILLMDSPIKHIGFTDITGSIGYIILLVLLGISNFVPTFVNMKYINPQQKVEKKKTATGEEEENFTETFTQSMNTSTLYVMPVMITISMLSLPSIISIYLIFQNLVGVLQQVIVKVFYDRRSNTKEVVEVKPSK